MLRVDIEAKLAELSNKDELTTAESNLMHDCEIALGHTSAKPVTVAAAWKRCRKALTTPEDTQHHATKKAEIRYVFRGSVERGTGGSYKWHDSYSEDAPGGGIVYPWLTKREAQADAKARGGRAVFVSSNLAGPTKAHHAARKKSPSQLDREIAETLGSRPINRRKRVRHFSEWQDKTGATHYAVTYEDLSGHAITRDALQRYRQHEARG